MKNLIAYIQESATAENSCKKIKNEIVRLKCLNHKSRWFNVESDNSGNYIFISVPGDVDEADKAYAAINDFVTAEGYKYETRITSKDSDYVILKYQKI